MVEKEEKLLVKSALKIDGVTAVVAALVVTPGILIIDKGISTL